MKDKTRKAMDELGHLFVKDALEHALKMKYALMLIRKIVIDGDYSEPGLVEICEKALNDK